MKRPIENNSRKGDYVYEPFSGSGTTIIACEMTGRRCCAIEIDEGYVEVAIERWQKFTGQEATLDGKTLAQVKQARSRKPTTRKTTSPVPSTPAMRRSWPVKPQAASAGPKKRKGATVVAPHPENRAGEPPGA